MLLLISVRKEHTLLQQHTMTRSALAFSLISVGKHEKGQSCQFAAWLLFTQTCRQPEKSKHSLVKCAYCIEARTSQQFVVA